MPIIKWRDSYSVGVEQFDNEHRKLVELINRMFAIVRDKGDVMELSDAVARLIDYTQFHFESEEAALEKSNFPGLEAHRKKHAELARQVTGFQQRLLNEDAFLMSTEFYRFLRDWLLEHIIQEDMKYSRFLANAEDGQV